MLESAQDGLTKRGMCEEEYLQPLFDRLAAKHCPADNVIRQFRKGGIKEIVSRNEMRKLF